MVVEQVKDCKIVNGEDKIIHWTKKWLFIDIILKKEKIDYQWIENKHQPYIIKVKMADYYVQYNIYVSNVTYLGNPHPKYKKRMQLSESADKSYLKIVNDPMNITLLLGLYVYDENNPIIVAWDSSANQNAGKSKSSHVYVNDLQLAMINGANQRIDKYRNNVYCFQPKYLVNFFNYNHIDNSHSESFLSFLRNTGLEFNEYYFIEDMVKYLKEDLKDKNYIWDGKISIKEMKENNFSQWKQTEWQGFFFEFLIEKIISERLVDDSSQTKHILEMPGPIYGKTKFDSFYNIPWDLKVHSNNSNSVITNDLEAIQNAINDYGKVGFIIVSGESTYENDHEFSDWRNELKGGLSKNQKENIAKNKKHRKLKVQFKPERITVVTIDNNSIKKHTTVGGFHNPNGNVRRDKLSLDFTKIDEEILIDALFED